MFGDLVVNLIARVNQFTQPMARAKVALNSFNEGAQTTVTGVIATFSRLTGIGTVIGGLVGSLSIAAALIAGLKLGATLANDLEKSQAAFNVMIGDTGKATKMLDELRAMGRQTGYGAGIQKAAETMLGFGVAQDKVMPGLRAIADIARGDAERLSSLSLAFAQSASAGRLMGQDLLQMVNAGFNPLQEISRKTGESITELKKRMEDGKIPFEEVFQAFISATQEGGKFNGMMETIANTTGGRFNIMSGTVGEVMREIATALMSGFDVRDAIGDLSSFVEYFRRDLSDWIPVLQAIGFGSRIMFDVMLSSGKVVYALLSVLRGMFQDIYDIGRAVVGVFITLEKKKAAPADELNKKVAEAQARLPDIMPAANALNPAQSEDARLKKAKEAEEHAATVRRFSETAAQRNSRMAEEAFVKARDVNAGTLDNNAFASQYAEANFGKPKDFFASDEDFQSQIDKANGANGKRSGDVEERRRKANEAQARWETDKRKENAKQGKGWAPGSTWDEASQSFVGGERSVGDKKQAGALGVRTQEAYRAIVSAMTGQRSDPQAEQSRTLKKLADNSDDLGHNIRRIKEKLVDQGDQVLERI